MRRRAWSLATARCFHDVAKGLPGIRGEKDGEPTDYGHADKGAELAYAALRRLGYPEAFARDVNSLSPTI